MKIALLDSGIGGLNVLKQAIQILPSENYIYYADNLNVPYGKKTKEEICKYVFHAVEFLLTQPIKALVIACNTATSAAANELRKTYPELPIIGMEPAIKPACKKYCNTKKRILVLATELTLREEKITNLIHKLDGNNVVDLLALPDLVTFAENLEFSSDKIDYYLLKQLASYELAKYGAVVLGCTHFLFFVNKIKNILPDAEIFEGGFATIQHLKNVLDAKKLLENNDGNIELYFSGEKKTEACFDILSKINLP